MPMQALAFALLKTGRDLEVVEGVPVSPLSRAPMCGTMTCSQSLNVSAQKPVVQRQSPMLMLRKRT